MQMVVIRPYRTVNGSSSQGNIRLVATQTLAHYEVGRLRLPVVLVPKVAALFGVPTDVLLGVTSARTAAQKKRGPTPKLQRQLERVSRLPKAQQQVVLAMLDGVLLQHG
jgi:hypothetical protein